MMMDDQAAALRRRVPGLSAGQPFPCSHCYPDIFTDLGRIE
jgi:hypothetical protein